MWRITMALQFITQQTERYSHYESAKLALEGGCRWVQLRMKDTPIEEVRKEAIRIKELCLQYEAIFIIDDYVDLVKELQADGVHIGKNDMPIHEARQVLGGEYLIGGTANTFDEIVAHIRAEADYIGCGPYRFTTTKKNLSPILGIEGYTDIVSKMKDAGIRIPIVAIGGITAEDIPSVMQTGVSGIALSGSIVRAENPVEETKRIIELINKNK